MFPYPCWLNDKYLFIISRTLPMCMVISWVYIVAISTKRIVYEKELRLKEVCVSLINEILFISHGISHCKSRCKLRCKSRCKSRC